MKCFPTFYGPYQAPKGTGGNGCPSSYFRCFCLFLGIFPTPTPPVSRTIRQTPRGHLTAGNHSQSKSENVLFNTNLKLGVELIGFARGTFSERFGGFRKTYKFFSPKNLKKVKFPEKLSFLLIFHRFSCFFGSGWKNRDGKLCEFFRPL